LHRKFSYSNGYGFVFSDSLKINKTSSSDAQPRLRKNYAGIAPLGILHHDRIQYERMSTRFGYGAIITKYNVSSSNYDGGKIEPFLRIYHKINNAPLAFYIHLQAGAGMVSLPYKKVVTDDSDPNNYTFSIDLSNNDIKKHSQLTGYGFGVGMKIITKKNLFIDICMRNQQYHVNAGVVQKTDGNKTITYYPKLGNFHTFGPGAEWVCSVIMGYRF
jgi:hypothetical protein